MLIRLLIVCSFLLSDLDSARAQTLITWEDLTQVTFKKTFDPAIGIEILTATYGPRIKELNGKEVLLKGYIIPLDPLGTQYVISRNPMATCFFCGGSGPETVAELHLHPKSLRRYATDEVHTFKGKLKINEANDKSLHYVIEMAERM